MLQIWILNVGHGDSIVLKYTGPNGPAYGVIDSNRESVSVEPAALTLLRELNATELSFVLWSHPHADHFSGLSAILAAFPVKTFYTYPMGRDIPRLKKHGLKYLESAQLSESPTIKNQAMEFGALIVTAENKRITEQMEWQDLTGPTNRVRPHGFEGVTINALLPFKKVKGEYFNALDANRADSVESEPQNELCIALDIKYGDHHVALCADAPKRAWTDHRKELQKSRENLSFSAVKIPHHGSHADCDDTVLDYLFPQIATGENRTAIVSAGGSKHHPAEAVLRSLHKRKIKPYCTNLSKICGSNKVAEMMTGAKFSPEIVKQLRVAGAQLRNGPARQACQGNIRLDIPPQGEIKVENQLKNACWFRGDFDAIISSLGS